MIVLNKPLHYREYILWRIDLHKLQSTQVESLEYISKIIRNLALPLKMQITIIKHTSQNLQIGQMHLLQFQTLSALHASRSSLSRQGSI